MKRFCLSAVILAAIAVVPAFAGDTYVPSNTPTSGTCNVIPFSGPWPSTNPTGEWRYQSYQTAAQLGNTPFRITDISFAPCGSGALTGTDLEVRISHTTVPASSTFATNLPSPVTVLKLPTFTYTHTTDTWCPLGLTCPFEYNGTDNLTVEIRYKNGAITGHSGSCHRDTHTRIYATGAGAYGIATGSMSSAALKIRFTHADLTPSNSNPLYGTKVALNLDSSADAGKFYFCASSLNTGSFWLGCWEVQLATDNLFLLTIQNLAPTMFINYQGILDSAGQAKAEVDIPNDHNLVGVAILSSFAVMGTSGIDAVSPNGSFKISSP